MVLEYNPLKLVHNKMILAWLSTSNGFGVHISKTIPQQNGFRVQISETIPQQNGFGMIKYI
jgi:hypothetical protein